MRRNLLLPGRMTPRMQDCDVKVFKKDPPPRCQARDEPRHTMKTLIQTYKHTRGHSATCDRNGKPCVTNYWSPPWKYPQGHGMKLNQRVLQHRPNSAENTLKMSPPVVMWFHAVLKGLLRVKQTPEYCAATLKE